MPARANNATHLARRWRKLPEGSRNILTAAALHTGELPDARLAELAVNPADVDPVVAGGWLIESSRGHWRLALDPGVVQSLAPWSVRRAAHLALARILERSPHLGAQAAAHFESAGQLGEAGRVWLATARLHTRSHQHRAAGHCFAEAIRLLPDGTPEAELVAAVRDFGVCAALQRELKPATELLQAWRERAGWSALQAFQGHAARVLADLLTRQGRHVEAAQTRRAAARHFLQAGLDGDAAGEMLAAAGTLAWALRFTAALEAAADALAQARACGRPDLESHVLAVQGLTLGMLGETARGRAALEAALEIASTHRLTTQAADAHRLMGNVDDYASSYDDPTSVRKVLARRALPEHTVRPALCLGGFCYALFRSGRWTESLRLARQMAEEADSTRHARVAGLMAHGMIRIMRGELRPGMALVESAQDLGRRMGIGPIEIFAWTALATAHEMGHRPADATVCYRRLMDYWLTTEDRHDALQGFCAAVTFFSGQGDRTQAAEFAAPLQRFAAATSNREVHGSALYAAAELKLFDQEPAEAAEAFRQALAAFDERSCCIEAIRTRLRLAAALTASGESTQAATFLRDARSRASRLGCRPLAAVAGEALRRVTNRKAARPDAFLSPRQRDVAQHLSAGRTNKEIAAALGLSVRTVDMHVAHLFDRLECRTRTEAAAKLAGLPGL